MDDILVSHLIDPGWIRADNFENFFQARERAILERISEAMGKPIMQERVNPEDITDDDYEGALANEENSEE